MKRAASWPARCNHSLYLIVAEEIGWAQGPFAASDGKDDSFVTVSVNSLLSHLSDQSIAGGGGVGKISLDLKSLYAGQAVTSVLQTTCSWQRSGPGRAGTHTLACDMSVQHRTFLWWRLFISCQCWCQTNTLLHPLEIYPSLARIGTIHLLTWSRAAPELYFHF